MIERKCPKCGGCVPEGNNNCNHCGHKMSLFGGGLYVGSSKNANKLDTKENPFNDGNSNKVYKWIIIIFVLGFILNIFISILEDGNIDLDDVFEDMFSDYDVDIDFDDDYLNFGNEDYCYNSCGSYDYEVDANTNCLCYNGDIYDNNGNRLFKGTSSTESNLKARCEYFCDESAVMIDSVCHCKSGNKYNSQGFKLPEDNEYVIRSIMSKIDNGDKIFVYGPGSNKEGLDPVELVDFMAGYNLEVYYFDFSTIKGTLRSDLRNIYKFANYSTPHFYIFENGSIIYQEINVSTKEYLRASIDNYYLINKPVVN